MSVSNIPATPNRLNRTPDERRIFGYISWLFIGFCLPLPFLRRDSCAETHKESVRTNGVVSVIISL